MEHRTESPTKPPRVAAWFALIQAIVSLYLVTQAARLTLFLGRWPLPIRYSSLIMLLVMLGIIWYGLLRLLRWGRTLSLKRTVIIILILFIVTVFFIGMNNPSEEGPLKSFQNAAIAVPRTASQWIIDGFWAIVRFPGQMWTAYTGKAAIGNVPGATNRSTEPVIINVPNKSVPIGIPATPPREQPKVDLGDTVATTSQAALLCKMSVLADGPFPAEASVTIIEGPRIKEGGLWWRVQNDMGIGWCPASTLVDVTR